MFIFCNLGFKPCYCSTSNNPVWIEQLTHIDLFASHQFHKHTHSKYYIGLACSISSKQRQTRNGTNLSIFHKRHPVLVLIPIGRTFFTKSEIKRQVDD